jgi:hypothetical protein
MSTRKAFLNAAASSALVAAAPSSPKPGHASPAPSPKPPKISPSARALAQSMRAFDAGLSDRDIEKIARGIDANLKLGPTIDPKGRALKNWDEPAVTFKAAE